ncbi:IS481 family transposase [Cellulomonas sp. PSBB021]|uniref:IS481 family transposase n=1 Tax=Cellulomonas sp. PSBB021 TaxID=2003551 RepID=UPI0012FE546C|nr:IS481 family transposase [Cellulomonas sp. PSBB021]
MVHANARLTPHGRWLLVQRVRVQGRPVAHVARELGVSRQCAHRWVARFDAQGRAGLQDRSSRPRRSPAVTSPERVALVLAARERLRRGPDELARATGVPARTVSRILRRAHVPYLWQCDPISGEPIRASKVTAVRYEHAHPGDLVHVDVKKVGRIPQGGGWRAHGRAGTQAAKKKRPLIGYDYVHAAVDDYSRVAYAEILPDEKGATCAGFIDRALTHFAALGTPVRAVLTDNHWSYAHAHEVAAVLAAHQTAHWFIKAHCPWQNGKVERFNRTLASEWAYRHPWTSNDQRTTAFTTWLNEYNTERHHHAVGAAPVTRLSPT